MKLSDLTVKYKLATIVALAIIFIAMACTYNLIQQRTSSLNEREDKLSAQVEATVSLVQHYYDQRQTLGEEAAKQQALDAIKALRYDAVSYTHLRAHET